MIRRLKGRNGQIALELVLFLIVLVLLLTACGWFGGGSETVATDGTDIDAVDQLSFGDDGASDNTTAEDDIDAGDEIDDDTGDNDEPQVEAIDEEAALDIIRAGAVDSGVAPEQRAGTISVFTQVRVPCSAVDDQDLEQLNLVFPDVLEFCVDNKEDFWQVELFDPQGNPLAVTWHQSSFITHDFAIDDPRGVYRLIATSRNGGRVEADVTVGQFSTLTFESVELAGSPALALAGYGDKRQMFLSAYAADDVPAVAMSEDTVLYDGWLNHVTDLGPIPLDTDGLTIIPVQSEFDRFCLFPLVEEDFLTPFTCFGEVPDREIFTLGANDLEQQLQKELGGRDLRLALPVTTTLADGSRLTVATTIEPGSGRPVGAAAFVQGATDPAIKVHALVESKDFVSAWAAICREVSASISVRSDPCQKPTTAPKIVFFDPKLDIKTEVLVAPKKPKLPVRNFDYVIPIRPDLVLDPDLLDSLRDAGALDVGSADGGTLTEIRPRTTSTTKPKSND